MMYSDQAADNMPKGEPPKRLSLMEVRNYCDSVCSLEHALTLTAEPDSSKKEIYASWAIFILIMLLIVAFFTSYTLQQRKVTAVHETVISIFAGEFNTGFYCLGHPD